MDLKKLRESKKMSQTEVADFCEVSKMSVSNWESGSDMTLANARKLVELYKISLDELAGLPITSLTLSNGANSIVPLLTAEQVKIGISAEQIKDKSIMVSCSYPHSRSAYAMDVLDASNTSNGPESIPVGFSILCDPFPVEPIESQDMVTFKNEHGHVLFGKYVMHGGKDWIEFLNPTYTNVTSNFEILAKIIGITKKL